MPRQETFAGYIATAVAVAALVPATASAALVRVSGDGVPECSGPKQVRGYEVEPSLASDASGSLLVGAWQQDRTDAQGRGAIADMVGISTDGGQSWSRQLVEGVSACGGGQFENATDPWVDIGPDGTIYVASLGNTKGGPGASVWVQSSTDGGETWNQVLVDGPNASDDKETLTADPFVPGRAWVAWQQGEEGRGLTQLISRTLDGGVTWSEPVAINPETLTADVHILPVAPDRLLAVYSTTAGAFGSTFGLEVAVSTDGGQTFSAPREIVDYSSGEVFLDKGRFPVRGSASVFSATSAVDGAAYAAIQEVGSGQSRIRLVRSLDGGETWTTRVAVGTKGAAMVPAVAASAGGSVAVSYFTIRGNAKENTRYRVATSTDHGTAWDDQALTRRFDPRKARSNGSVFLGDYTGLTEIGGGGNFGALISAAKPLAENGPTDIFFSSLTAGQ